MRAMRFAALLPRHCLYYGVDVVAVVVCLCWRLRRGFVVSGGVVDGVMTVMVCERIARRAGMQNSLASSPVPASFFRRSVASSLVGVTNNCYMVFRRWEKKVRQKGSIEAPKR